MKRFGPSWSSAVLVLACASQSPPPATADASPAPIRAVREPEAPKAAAPTPAATRATPPHQASCETATLAERGYSMSREFEPAVSDFAVGTPPTVAARHADSIHVYDGRTWKKLPELERPPTQVNYRLFFGRDNQPRLMGYENGPSPRGFYRRFKGGRFQPEPSELGPLGAPNGALYGVLGFADPEVVCKPRELCLVKRLSGWNRVPAHDAPVPIILGRGDAWAFVENSLEHLEAKGFRAFSPAPPLEHPTALWADERALPWVLDGSTLLRMTKDSGWARSEVPFASPLALAGSSSSEVWLAGEGGAALFDGTRFVCIRDLPGPFSGITRAGDDWWFWGAEGAFRLRRTPRD